jgi:uncharacterized membrane protein YphA (DoxX/SURF4 family)
MTQEAQDSAGGRARGGKGLHVGLWVAQVLLAILFGMAGLMKLFTPYEHLVSTQAWARSIPAPLVKLIGTAEIAGVLGVILPAATRIKPMLTPLAAAGFVVIMILASFVHVSIGEPPVANVIIGGLAAFVAWGRW